MIEFRRYFLLKFMKIIGYTLCLNNDDYTVSLEVRKIYPIIAPRGNDPEGYRADNRRIG